MLRKSSKNKWLGVKREPTATKRAGVQSSITKFLTESKNAKRSEEQQKPAPSLLSSLSQTVTPKPAIAPRAGCFAHSTFRTRSSTPVTEPTQTSSVSPSPSSTNPLRLPPRRHRNPAPATPVVIDCTSDDDRRASVPQTLPNKNPQVHPRFDALLDPPLLDEEYVPEPAARTGWRGGYRNRGRSWRGGWRGGRRGGRRGGWRGGRGTPNVCTRNYSTFHNHYDTGSGMMSGDSLGIDFGGGGWEGIGSMGMGDMAGEEMNYDDFE